MQPAKSIFVSIIAYTACVFVVCAVIIASVLAFHIRSAARHHAPTSEVKNEPQPDQNTAASVNTPATPSPLTLPAVRAKNIQWPFFSSTTGKPICKLNIGKILPASRRSGPFIMPAPG